MSVPEDVEVPVCKNVPDTECQTVKRTVLDKECKDVEYPQCTIVPKQVEFEVPVEVILHLGDNQAFESPP